MTQDITANLYGHSDVNVLPTIEQVVSLVVPGCLILASGSFEDGIVINIMGMLSGASSLLSAKKSSILIESMKVSNLSSTMSQSSTGFITIMATHTIYL